MSEVQVYKCPCCDAPLIFDADSGGMHCEYCGTKFSAEDTKEYIDALEKEKKQDVYEWEQYGSGSGKWTDEELKGIKGYICPSCGGEVIGDEHTASMKCPYCGNPTIVGENVSGTFKPDVIIPFKITKEEAKAALLKHYKGKLLLPKEFKDENHIDEIRGLYVPFWFYDCDTDSNLTYKATRVRHWADSRYNYTETSHFLIKRAGTLSFNSVPADGSSKLDDTIMQSIEPFRTSDMVEFSSSYLSGFSADKYDIEPDVLKPTVNARVKQSVINAFRSTVHGYTTVIPATTNVNIKEGRIKYGLMPVWMLNTKYHDKQYTFAMNGDTGRFVGDLPVSWKRFFAFLFGIGVSLSAVGTLILFIAENM